MPAPRQATSRSGAAQTVRGAKALGRAESAPPARLPATRPTKGSQQRAAPGKAGSQALRDNPNHQAPGPHRCRTLAGGLQARRPAPPEGIGPPQPSSRIKLAKPISGPGVANHHTPRPRKPGPSGAEDQSGRTAGRVPGIASSWIQQRAHHEQVAARDLRQGKGRSRQAVAPDAAGRCGAAGNWPPVRLRKADQRLPGDVRSRRPSPRKAV